MRSKGKKCDCCVCRAAEGSGHFLGRLSPVLPEMLNYLSSNRDTRSHFHTLGSCRNPGRHFTSTAQGNQRRVGISLPKNEGVVGDLWAGSVSSPASSPPGQWSPGFPHLSCISFCRCRCWTSSPWREARRTPSRGSSPSCQVGQGAPAGPGLAGAFSPVSVRSYTDFSSYLNHLSHSQFLVL